MSVIIMGVILLWLGWLLFDGLITQSVWVRGGVKDRYTRDLDMHSFAHKVSRAESPITYWIMMLLYTGFEVFLIYLMFN